MNRTDKRSLKRAAEAFDARKTFAHNEMVEANLAAYNFGVEHALEAAAIAYGLGATRLQKVRETLQLLQVADFELNAEVAEMKEAKKSIPAAKLNRAQRRALEKSKKGAVLFERR